MLFFLIFIGFVELIALMYWVKSTENIEDLEVEFYKTQEAGQKHLDKINRLEDDEKNKALRDKTRAKLDESVRRIQGIKKSLKRKTFVKRIIVALQFVFILFAIFVIQMS